MTYQVKGRYYGWKIDDVPAGELLRACNGEESVPIWIQAYVHKRRTEFENEVRDKNKIPSIYELANKKFNEATFLRELNKKDFGYK